MNWKLSLLYKNETSEQPIDFIIDCYRSKGQWVIPVDSYLHGLLEKNIGTLEIPDIDYIEWLENKVIELIKNN